MRSQRRHSRAMCSTQFVRAPPVTIQDVRSAILTPVLTARASTRPAGAFTLTYGTETASKYGTLNAIRFPKISLLAALIRLPGQLLLLSFLTISATWPPTSLIIALSSTPRSAVTGRVTVTCMATQVAQEHAPGWCPRRQTLRVRLVPFNALACDKTGIDLRKPDAYWTINSISVYTSG
jgi:hypothetical protein